MMWIGNKNLVIIYIIFLQQFFKLSKPHLKNISFIITGMLSAESVVTADVSRKLKDDFSFVNLESIERRFRRFFNSFSSVAYSFFEAFISSIISKFTVKHADKKIHISFDHMFCKDKFVILLFALRIGKQGIPIWFRCFKGKDNPNAFSIPLINEGVSFCANLFKDKNYHVIFLADRWFPLVDVLEHIQSLNCFYCVRTRLDLTYSYYSPKGRLHTQPLSSITPWKASSRVLKDVFFTKRLFKTNIVVSTYSNTDDPWYLLTNDDTSRAIRNYSYRFGSIECIFKSQKTNGFRLESTNTKLIEHFISLFTVMCIALTWLTILGSDYVKNKNQGCRRSKRVVHFLGKYRRRRKTNKIPILEYGLE